jgi:hypothetical protein
VWVQDIITHSAFCDDVPQYGVLSSTFLEDETLGEYYRWKTWEENTSYLSSLFQKGFTL